MSNILIGIPCLRTGGTEMQTLHLVESLISGGHHCVTVCYFEYDFSMVQLFEKAGSKVVCLSAYGKRPQKLPDVYRFIKSGLKRVVAEYRPKIAHIQYMAPGAMPIFILRKLGLKTIIATVHTDASTYRSLRLVHFLQRRMLTAFTCVTEVAEKSFFGCSKLYNKDFLLAKHNHFTIHNCLPPSYTIANTRQPNIDSEIVIGVVARLVEIKGVDYVMPAFAQILKSQPKCKLMIVGDGYLRNVMEQQQHDFNIPEGKVEWIGSVPYEKIMDYYKQMTIVWVPSRSEGFGLSAIEAMACGCPVVASNTGGVTEIMNDSVDGLLFENGNSDDLAEKTIKLISDEEQTNKMREQAISKAKQFTFDHYQESINSLYSKLTTLTKV